MKTSSTEEHVGRVGNRREVVIPFRREDTLSPEDAKIVRRGETQLKRGESKPWRAVKHALPR
jgi:hypothetical protein